MKIFFPYIAVAVTVFMGVMSSFVCSGVFAVRNETDNLYNNKAIYERKNIFVSVKDSLSDTLEVSMLVSFNPADGTIKTVYIPADTLVKVALSDQMFKYTHNIGGIEMMRENGEKIIPLNIDYYVVINSADLYCPDGNYRGVVDSIFSTHLWGQDNLKEYLHQLLNVANTDLTMFKIDDYVKFINRFSQRTNEYYNVPGKRQSIGGKTFFVVDGLKMNELINQSILN